MKVQRSITIDNTDFAPLHGELTALTSGELSDINPQTQEGHQFFLKYPTVSRLMGFLKAEAVKEQSMFNYERIGS